MDQFPSEAHLASWTGICPGNEESAGKRKRSKTTKGNRWLRRALTQAAWAATHTKDSYLGNRNIIALPAAGARNAPWWPWRTRYW